MSELFIQKIDGKRKTICRRSWSMILRNLLCQGNRKKQVTPSHCWTYRGKAILSYGQNGPMQKSIQNRGIIRKVRRFQPLNSKVFSPWFFYWIFIHFQFFALLRRFPWSINCRLGGEYIDPRQILLPQSLEATEWKRFCKLNDVDEAIVFVPISNYCDLITNNRHLMHSEVKKFVHFFSQSQIHCFWKDFLNLSFSLNSSLYGVSFQP